MFVLILIGCSDNNDLIRYPENIIYSDEMVIWDAVPNAVSYSIKINNDVFSVHDTSFSLFLLPNGTYDIRLRSHAADGLSYFSPALTIIINRTYETFDEIVFDHHLISWSEINGVSTYEIYNNLELLASTQHTQFDLSSLELEVHRLYQIRLAAVYPTTDRIFSNTFIYHTYEDLDITIETTFNHNQIEFLTFNVGSQLTIDYLLFENQLIDESLFSLEDGMLTLQHDGFHPDELGIQKLTILTPSGFIHVFIEVVNILNPTMISNDHVIYQEDVDMIFFFELNEGLFLGLSGNNITLDDYTFEDETLTISSSYVKRILNDNPSRTTIILVYQLSKNSNVIMGFIFISIPQE